VWLHTHNSGVEHSLGPIVIDVFNYLEYREFLRDYYQEQKKDKSFFSYRFIGLKAGMHSSYVIKVLQGTLHIAPKKIESFIKLLNLSEAEANYFEALVHFGRAKTDRQRKLYFDKLFEISTVKAQKLAIHQYEFFQKWYYSAIWSIINCQPFKGDYKALGDLCKPAIPINDAKRAVLLLEKLDLIVKKADGSYVTTETNLTTGQKWHSQAVAGFQREMINLAGESLERAPKNERDLSTVTLCIDEKDFPEIQEHIRLFRTSLIKLVNGHNGSGRVYQLNVQLFPLSADLKGSA
jgi:uncharacterized protein (TIGR02147 family)